MNYKEVNLGIALLVVGLIVLDLSRKNSILRSLGNQIASIGINDVIAGLLG